MHPIALSAVLLVLARGAIQLWLAQLNRHHVRQHSATVPESFRQFVSPETFRQSIQYTLAKNRLHQVEVGWETLRIGIVLFSGVLPLSWSAFTSGLGTALPAQAAFLFLVMAVLAVCSWPLDWYEQFKLEQRFGFNTASAPLWWMDRLKGMLLTAALGYPLILGLLTLAEWSGRLWWLWAWGALVLFQSVMMVLGPVVILPLFNKFTPLPEGPLRERLMDLARKTHFLARSIQVMDGSKRSKHSNAFFTGFGRFRKIVLFDTLIAQLTEPELAAVLAHEIGHDRKGHLLQTLLVGLAGLLGGCFLLGWLADADWFYRAFGFPPGQRSVAFLLFGLLAGPVTFWLSPLVSLWSRRFEYQADAFAAETMGEGGSLIGALRKLNEKNLSNLIPHPLYSAFYYSHPTLLEREQALRD